MLRPHDPLDVRLLLRESEFADLALASRLGEYALVIEVLELGVDRPLFPGTSVRPRRSDLLIRDLREVRVAEGPEALSEELLGLPLVGPDLATAELLSHSQEALANVLAHERLVGRVLGEHVGGSLRGLHRGI